MTSVDANLRVPEDLLASCNNEPIHVPGCIQPHGVLFALNPRDVLIEQVSDNAEAVFGHPAESLVGQDIAVALGQDFASQLRELVDNPNFLGPHRIECVANGRQQIGVVHLWDDVLIVEVEPADEFAGDDPSPEPIGQVQALRGLIAVGAGALSLRDFSQRLVEYVRNLTGYDRVIVYQFDHQNDGEVIAESCAESLECYIGHRFPASDIPDRARALYVVNRNRMLADIDYRPSPVVPIVNPRTGRPLDMTLSALRSVSPIHAEYLRNMRVKATLTISIVESGRLWGLITCHHRRPKRLGSALHLTMELLCDYAAEQIFWHASRDSHRFLVARDLDNARLEAALNSRGEWVKNLFKHPDVLLSPLCADGAALSIDGDVTTTGDVPSGQSIATLVGWLKLRSPALLFHTDYLGGLEPRFQSFREVASGVVAVAISRVRPCYLIWFRGEKSRSIRWAGDPRKGLVEQADGTLRLSPRKSFETWVEEVRGHADPWTSAEIDAARSIRLLIAIKRADDASQFKSEFLANMSHEIRTPMTAILGYADILAQDMEQLSPADRQAILRTIKASGTHLLGLLQDILDLSRIDAGRLDVSRGPCSLASLACETIALLRVPAESKGLRLSVDFEGPIPESIQTDPRRLRQVLLNLLGNAIKFTDEGQVRMVVRLDRSEPSGPAVAIDVIDTGLGMTAEQLTRVFRPFIQADSSMSRKFGGAGLGLAISKNLAEMLGGTLTVESRYGRGSTFRLRIDAGSLADVRMCEELTEAEILGAAPAHTPAPRAMDRLAGRVLLAEDHEVNRLLVARMLTAAGADVVVVDNGEDAVETALKAEGEGRPFVVILMDMHMPILDGLDATVQLRSWGYSRSIIALTAGAMQGDREECLQAGCDDYLTKPIKRQDLIAVIAALEARQASETGDVRP